MHTILYSITYDQYQKDSQDIEEVASIAVPRVDYVQHLDKQDEKRCIENLLGMLKNAGCEVDMEKRSFKVADREKLARFFLSDFTDKKPLPLTITSYEELAGLFSEIRYYTSYNYPCIKEGSMFLSLFDALKDDMFGAWKTISGNYTYYICGAYDCHF